MAERVGRMGILFSSPFSRTTLILIDKHVMMMSRANASAAVKVSESNHPKQWPIHMMPVNRFTNLTIVPIEGG